MAAPAQGAPAVNRYLQRFGKQVRLPLVQGRLHHRY